MRRHIFHGSLSAWFQVQEVSLFSAPSSSGPITHRCPRRHGECNLFFRRRMRGLVFLATLLEVGVWPHSPSTTRFSPERYLQPGSLTNTSANEASKAALSRLPCTGARAAGGGWEAWQRACVQGLTLCNQPGPLRQGLYTCGPWTLIPK